MELQNQNGTPIQNGTAKEINNKAAQNGVAKLPNNGGEKKPAITGNANAETQKPAGKEVRAEIAKQEMTMPNVPSNQPEKANTEIQQPIKLALNLEATLKTVDTLHRKSVQRLNLISRLKQIEAFEVTLANERDELEDNPFQGCKLIIEDDKQRCFVTTTPGLIRLISQFIFSACHEKLTEIEASIVFPKI